MNEEEIDLNCNECNYDTHKCGGCGESVPHGKYECQECKDYYESEKDNMRLGTE